MLECHSTVLPFKFYTLFPKQQSMYSWRRHNVFADMMLNDASSTQERELSSNKSIKQKYPLVYHSKTKLSSDVSIIMANINE